MTLRGHHFYSALRVLINNTMDVTWPVTELCSSYYDIRVNGALYIHISSD